MKMWTYEAHYVYAKELCTLRNCKQLKHTKQIQTNQEHYATAGKWRTLCFCKQMKHIMQLQINEAN